MTRKGAACGQRSIRRRDFRRESGSKLIMATLFTLGHSNRSIETFVTLLTEASIELLVDVRRFPSSRRLPHFNGGRLKATLAAHRIRYDWVEDLGGRRDALPLELTANPGIRDPALRGYADWMRTPTFRFAFDQLRERAAGARIVVMCAEKSPEDCHRLYLSDYLVTLGDEVLHLGEPGAPAPHRVTRGMHLDDSGLPAYPASGQQKLPL